MAHSDVEDDIWADSDNEEQVAYERNLAEKEWERLQEDHGNVSLYFLFYFLRLCDPNWRFLR